jgi:acyl carrier protein
MVEDERVREVAVVMKQVEGEHRLVGYYVEWDGQEVSEAELRERVKQKLTRQMLPAGIVKLREMPMTPNGKVDRRQLSGMREESSGTAEKRAARTETEERVIGIWKEVLGIEAVGIDEDFFDLGGHSLLATQVISRVREVFQVDLSVQDVFVNHTVTEFAAHIDVTRWAAQEIQSSSAIVEEGRMEGSL